MAKIFEEEEQRYICLKCKGHAIYLSVTARDKEGTLMCLNCGESEDAKYGIEQYLSIKQVKKQTRRILKGGSR